MEKDKDLEYEFIKQDKYLKDNGIIILQKDMEFYKQFMVLQFKDNL